MGEERKQTARKEVRTQVAIESSQVGRIFERWFADSASEDPSLRSPHPAAEPQATPTICGVSETLISPGRFQCEGEQAHSAQMFASSLAVTGRYF